MDLCAYLFNYNGLHPFHYHQLDWDLPEESKLDYMGDNSIVPTFSSLGSNTFLTLGNAVKLPIDRRYGDQDYYPTEAFVALLEDGGIVLGGGGGEEIRLTGGNIILSCPGDVFCRPGRNVNLWAGHDLILRAKNSFDISASKHDGRIKAENNMMLLGGNSGTGGILLESRGGAEQFKFDEAGEAVEFGGILLRATAGPIATWASEIYLRTGGGDIPAGPIVIDAGAGAGAIITNSAVVQHFVADVVQHFFGSDGNIEAADEFAASGAVLCGALNVQSAVVVNGPGLFKRGVTVIDGAFSTNLHDPFVGELDGLSTSRAERTLADAENILTVAGPASGQEVFNDFMEPQLYADQKIGNDDVIRAAEFGFRPVEEYITTNFVLFEDRWQQMARLSGQQLATWEEKPVTTNNSGDTFPYPGAGKFEDKIYFQQDLTIYDMQTGIAKDRRDGDQTNEAYATPKYADPTAQSLKEAYQVIQ